MNKRQPNHIMCFILTFLLLFMNIQAFAGTLVHVSKVSINKTTDTLIVGQTDTLKAKFTPVNATNRGVKWTSTNTTIAKVDVWGKVTTLKAGTTTITGTTVDKGLKIYCKINVKAKPVIRVTKVKINKTTDTLIAGQSDIVRATFTPANATNRGVKWISTNTTIATVDIYGKVTTLKAGTTTIMGITADKGLNIYCKITVKVKPTISVSKVTINKTTDTLVVGQTDIIRATFTPANATNRGVKWTSTNTTIATVDVWGKVTTLKAGTVTITGTTVDKGLKVSCNITVKPIPVVLVAGVSLNKNVDNLIVGDTDTLTSVIVPTNATNKDVTWTSSNASIATVDNTGKVTAVSAGTSTIMVTTADGSKTASCSVTVSNPIIKVTSVSLNKTSDALIVGDTDALTSVISPTNATNKDVTWTSSNASIATVDNTGKATAVSAGTSTITVTTADGSKTASCSITVSNLIIKVTSVSLNKASDALVVGDTDTLTSIIAPTNATNKDVKWASSDVAIATVDALGKITAVSAGTATITVATVDGSKIATCSITVNNPIITAVSLNKTTDALIVGDTDNLTSTIAPSNAVNKDVTWKSSDDSIATVDTLGKITAVGAGTATITVTTVDGSKTATCSVAVESLKIESINDINSDVYEGDNYTLPETVTVKMNNGTQATKAVVWALPLVDTSKVGLVTYNGTVEGYSGNAKVNLNVKSIASDLRVTGTTSILINNYFTSYGITLTSYIPKNINIEKVEVYSNGQIHNTYSKDVLTSNNIPTVINANSSWNIGFSFPGGISATNSYIIVYINNNGNIIPCKYLFR